MPQYPPGRDAQALAAQAAERQRERDEIDAKVVAALATPAAFAELRERLSYRIKVGTLKPAIRRLLAAGRITATKRKTSVNGGPIHEHLFYEAVRP